MNVTSWTLHEPLFMIYSWTLVHEYCIHEQFMNNSHLMLMNISWIIHEFVHEIVHELFMIFSQGLDLPSTRKYDCEILAIRNNKWLPVPAKNHLTNKDANI